jgi:hypothetical protein
LDFYGVLPDFSVRLIEANDRVNPRLEQVFREDINEYRQLETVDFHPEFTPRRGSENMKIDNFRLPANMERGMILWHSRERLRPQDIRPHGVKAMVAVETGFRPANSPEEQPQRFVKWAAFKRLDKSRILDQTVLRILWDRGTFDQLDGPGLTVAEGLDALYVDGTLYFYSDRTANGFLDLSEAFNEATEPQINDVMEQGVLLYAGEGTIHDFVNSMNKRAISMLWRSRRLAGVRVTQVKEYAEEYGIQLRTDGSGEEERILVPETNKGFKQLLDLLNQNYFPGIFDGEHYVANSKRPV